jgi:putative sigma-54 modulation protein
MDATAAEGPDESTEPQIIASRNVFAKPMSLEEAVLQMKLTDNEFIVFTDSSNEKVSVLYRRKDGNFGLIEPEVR